MSSSYKFFIQFENKRYQVEYRPNIDWVILESMGPITDDEYYKVKRYLRVEGFLDKGANYTII
jgi:hypothetical protein